IERIRFQKVIDHVQIKPFKCILLIGRHQDCQRGVWKGTKELQSAKPRHLDIKEYQVNGCLLKHVDGFHRIFTAAYQLKIRHLPDIILQKIADQFLVVYGQAPHHDSASLRVTSYQPSCSPIVSRYAPPYKRSSLFFTFVRPIPESRSLLVSADSGAIRFLTLNTNWPCCTDKWMEISGRSRWLVPCLKAFSTKGMSNMGSMRSCCPASGAHSIVVETSMLSSKRSCCSPM